MYLYIHIFTYIYIYIYIYIDIYVTIRAMHPYYNYCALTALCIYIYMPDDELVCSGSPDRVTTPAIPALVSH